MSIEMVMPMCYDISVSNYILSFHTFAVIIYTIYHLRLLLLALTLDEQHQYSGVNATKRD